MTLLIKNGRMIDGTGAPERRADLLVRDGVIAAIGETLRERADQTIDAAGLIITPGFIDILNHADAYLTILKNPQSESLLAQGITTAVIGNCGASLAPITHARLVAVVQKWADIRGINVDWERFGEFLDVIDRFRPGINFAGLVGHATLRRTILGDEARPANENELDAMKALLVGAMQDGAFGLSFAPSYAHARVAPQEEIDALVGVAQKAGGYLAVHLRDEGEGIVEAIREAVDIARRADISLQISHLKVAGRDGATTASSVLAEIDRAAQDGVRVHFDVFPWQTSFVVIYLLFPTWAQEGGLAALRKRLRDAELRKRIFADLRSARIEWEDYVVAEGHWSQNAVGKSLASIAKTMGVAPEEGLANLFLAHEGRVLLFRRGSAGKHLMDALRHERSFVVSAGGGYRRDDFKKGFLVHPRSFGAMPRFLGNFVLRKELLSLEEAVAKVTGRPAEKIGLRDRGTIAVGKAADLVLFDPDRLRNRASLSRPFRYPDGIRWVLVNGAVAVNPQGVTGIRAGRALRRISQP